MLDFQKFIAEFWKQIVDKNNFRNFDDRFMN